MLYFGGNRKLIQFVNIDFPNLKIFPPNILYITRAIDYYRKRLQFYIVGGIRPLKPILDSAYQFINEPNNKNFFNSLNNRNDIYLSPKTNHDKIFNVTELTPILEGNQLEDENNCSTNSDKNIEEEHNLDQKKNIFSFESGTKSESTFFSVIYSPQKPRNINGNNSPFFSSNCSILNDMIKNNKNFGKMITFKKHIVHNYPKKEKKNNDNVNVNDNKSNYLNDDSNIHIDRNISIINVGDSYNNLNINSEKNNININEENFADDNTIRIIDGCMNFNDTLSTNMKNNKDINDSIQLTNEDKNENINNNKNDESFLKEDTELIKKRIIRIPKLNVFFEKKVNFLVIYLKKKRK